MKRLLVLGGGQMGGALLGGVLGARTLDPSECAVVEVRAEGREALRARFPGVDVLDAPVAAESVLLAVKPGDVAAACASLAGGSYRRLLSVAAGISTATLEALLWPGAAVVRAMPNTPALIGVGAAAIAAGAGAGAEDLDWAASVLGATGLVVRLEESQLDAVTALSGSGPAYLFLVAEAMIDAGVLVGLARETATALVVQTLLGSARLLAESGDSPAQLRHAVTSPGGTTAAALEVLEQAAVRGAFLAAIRAAAARAAELGRS